MAPRVGCEPATHWLTAGCRSAANANPKEPAPRRVTGRGAAPGKWPIPTRPGVGGAGEEISGSTVHDPTGWWTGSRPESTNATMPSLVTELTLRRAARRPRRGRNSEADHSRGASLNSLRSSTKPANGTASPTAHGGHQMDVPVSDAGRVFRYGGLNTAQSFAG